MNATFAVLTVLLVGVVAAVAAGLIGGRGLDEPTSSLPTAQLPQHPMSASDIHQLRFAPALRGYRMGEVDRVLDRLAAELQWRDERIAALSGRGHHDEDDAMPASWPGDNKLS